MDDESWAELERMASAATAADALKSEEMPVEQEIARWRRLFSYSYWEAVALIRAQRGDLIRTRIGDEHWSLVQADREAAGHDRESYEHSQQLGQVLNSQCGVISSAEGDAKVIFKLGGLLDSAKKVGEILTGGAGELPTAVSGWSETGPGTFCLVSQDDKRKLDAWLAQARVAGKQTSS